MSLVLTAVTVSVLRLVDSMPEALSEAQIMYNIVEISVSLPLVTSLVKTSKLKYDQVIFMVLNTPSPNK